MSEAIAQAPAGVVERLWQTSRRRFERQAIPEPAAMQLLARSALLDEQNPPRLTRLTITCVSTLVLGFLGWSALMRMDEMTSAPGQILPESFLQPVQHLEGGIVDKVLVADGARVKAGQPIAVLQAAGFGSELEQLQARRAALALQAERLNAFADGRPPRFNTIVKGFDALKADQMAIYSSQVGALQSQLSVLHEQTGSARATSNSIAARRDASSRELALAREELRVRQELYDKGLSSKLALLNAQRDVERLSGEVSQSGAEYSRTQSSIAESLRRSQETRARMVSEARGEFGQVTTELAQLDEQLRRAEDKVKRLVLTAPIDGVVKGLAAHGVGAIVAPGGTMAEIVPDRNGVMAEVRVSPQDVGHVHAGQPALVKVGTFDFSRYGGIEGTVDYVSASSFTDERGTPFFKVRVKLSQDFVGGRSAHRQVTPGMTLVADIKTGNKSLLGYLVRPVTNALDSSFTER